MPLRLHIVKGTQQGESITVDIPQWNPVTGGIEHTVDEMIEMADEALKLADMRTLQDQTRMMEAYGLETECTAEEWSKIVSILDIVNGTQSADLVKRRWQSAREETAELEAARLAAICNDTAEDGTAEDNEMVYCQQCGSTVTHKQMYSGT